MIRNSRGTDFYSLRDHFVQQQREGVFDAVSYAMFAAMREALLDSGDKEALRGNTESLFNQAAVRMADHVAGVLGDKTRMKVTEMYNKMSPNERKIVFDENLDKALKAAGIEPSPEA